MEKRLKEGMKIGKIGKIISNYKPDFFASHDANT
jgi:hypothetical protein